MTELLLAAGVPCVPHHFFVTPKMKKWSKDSGCFSALLDFTSREYNYDVVLKPPRGKDGQHVYHCQEAKEIEKNAITIFNKGYGLTVSPYCDITHEYSVIMLNMMDEEPPRALLIYEKVRPYLLGDGVSTVKELFLSYLSQLPAENFFPTLLKRISSLSSDLDPAEVLPLHGKMLLNWQHNLSLGAHAEQVTDDQAQVFELLTNLATYAVGLLGLSLARVDIIEVDREYKILEIDSNFLLTRFAQTCPDGEWLAKEVYRSAIAARLGDDV